MTMQTTINAGTQTGTLDEIQENPPMLAIQDYIEIKPGVCHGSPVIRGTRIPVSHIINAMAGGDSLDDILEDYPGLHAADVYAALAFAGRLASFEEAPYDCCLA